MKHLHIYLFLILLFLSGCGNKSKEHKNAGKETQEDDIKLPQDYPPEFKMIIDGTILSVNIIKEGTEIMFSSESAPQSILERSRIAALESGYVEQNTGKENRRTSELTFFNEKKNITVFITVTSGSEGKRTLATIAYK